MGTIFDISFFVPVITYPYINYISIGISLFSILSIFNYYRIYKFYLLKKVYIPKMYITAIYVNTHIIKRRKKPD